MSSAHLVQLLLPVYGPDGARLDRSLHREVARELAERFGGVTAYSRAPAKGLWEEEPGRTELVVRALPMGRL